MRLKKPFLHGSPSEQLLQLRSWLFELVDMLNYIIEQLEEGKKHESQR